MTSIPELSDSDLHGFRTVQQLAYRCTEAIASTLEPGVTEREVARRMRQWLYQHGADDCFHQPFAWFGERTAFSGFIGWRHLGGFNPAFYPGNKRLQADMPFILDCAPSVRGFTADVGYSGVIGHNRILDQLMDDLLEYRELILARVRDGQPMSEVSRAVDRLCARHGYEPRHKAYPFEVLAHRVEKLSADPNTVRPKLLRFGTRSLAGLARSALRGRREGWSPLWSSQESSTHRPVPGLWAVEPHLGFRGVGAKWEELLVITESGADWLDDDVPHVRRAHARGLSHRLAA